MLAGILKGRPVWFRLSSEGPDSHGSHSPLMPAQASGTLWWHSGSSPVSVGRLGVLIQLTEEATFKMQ